MFYTAYRYLHILMQSNLFSRFWLFFLALQPIGYGCTPVRLYASAPLHVYACLPVNLYGSTPLRLHTCMAVRLYASTPIQFYASTPVRFYTVLRLYESTHVRLYGSTPVCLFDFTTLRLFYCYYSAIALSTFVFVFYASPFILLYPSAPLNL